MEEPDYLALIMAKILKHPTTHVLETVENEGEDEKVLEYLLIAEDDKHHRVLEIQLTKEEAEFLVDFQLTYYF